MFTLEDAIALATSAHDGQFDKSGRPYIRHPLRVMASVTGDHAQMAAVLHDVIEDTPVTADDLTARGCPTAVVDAVVALSHLPDEPQDVYLRRVAANPLALSVKRADIADNLSPARMARLDAAVQERLQAKYANALRLLAEFVS
ncbi:HD domain-containing protein [Lentzea sp. BCCO 10_0856]|uniref:HD domain-containing protein n=1 Tax=Lentzea miocenica TaxID=3095431 RepID=A0ABU4TAA9_9PSEU|nr:HD domain-containing protein [Lentzea sp. BCCO 10_0856]MDX8035102.1 HD domain-containing protein [Lentzea sp. BCCO 10_0856]